MNKKEAEIMNRVLQFLLKDGDRYGTYSLFKGMEEPTNNWQELESIIKKMIIEGGDYFKEYGGPHLEISINEFTQEFLDRGGFIKQLEIATAQKELEIRKQLKADEALRVSRKKDRVQLTIAIWQKYTFWPALVFGLFGGIYSMIQIFTTPKNVSQDQLGPKIDSIQNRLQSLENDIKHINTPIINDSIQTKE